MKQAMLFFVLIAAVSCSCPPCDSCQDPALLVVPETDGTPPTGIWSISQAVMNPDGTASSSISIVEDPSVPVNLTLLDNTQTTVHIEAGDDDSGIKCLRLEGGFGATCTGPTSGISLHGMLPKYSRCSGLINCGYKKMNATMEFLEQHFKACNAPNQFSNGQALVVAIIENMKGMTDTLRLEVHFNPATL